MNRIRRIRRIAAALACLGFTWLGLAVAPAAFAEQVLPGDGGPATATVTRTVLVGGMPGWQIALIAVVAALVAAAVAVLADRARAAHRRTVPSIA